MHEFVRFLIFKITNNDKAKKKERDTESAKLKERRKSLFNR